MAKLCALRGPWFDSAGNPLNGGKIYTYQTGSDTVKATYTDATAATPHPNPVILDSSGCKTLFLLTDTAYRFVVKTSGGTTTETVDEITPVTTFAAGVGNSDVNITDYALITDAGEDLHITPGAAGKLYLGSLQMPTAAPTTNQILSASDATTLQWGNPATGFLSSDSNPILAGDLTAGVYYVKFNDGIGIEDSTGLKEIVFYKTASAVNYVSLTNAATGSGPTFAAVGSDTNINLNVSGKGTGGVVANKLTVTAAATVGTTLAVTGTTTLAGMVQGGTTFPTSPGAGSTVLTANGSGGSSWSTVASLGAMIHLSTQTASASSALDFTSLISGSYRSYKFIFTNIRPTTNGAALAWRISTTNGSSWISTTAYGYNILYQYSSATSSDDTTGTYAKMAGSVSSAADLGCSGEMTLHLLSSNNTMGRGSIYYGRDSGVYALALSGGTYTSDTAVDAIRFLFSAGSISSGTISMYGIV